MTTFVRLGRSKQARVATADDLAKVLDLDDALWAASAVPTVTLRADAELLRLVDTDADGRLRSDELRAAIRWTFDALKDRAGVGSGSDTLALSAVNIGSADGAAVLDASKRILADAGTPAASSLSLAQVRAVRAAEEAKGLSAAGRVLPAAAAADAALAGFLEHILEVTGGEPHPLGGAAVTEASLARFLDEGAAWLAWHDAGALPESGGTEILPLRDATAAASDALAAVEGKLEQFFLLCDAVRLDAALAERARVDGSSTDLLDPTAATALLHRAPVAPADPAGVLKLDGALNPAWRSQVIALFAAAVKPLLGADTTGLDREGLGALRAMLAPYRAWSSGKPETKAGDRGAEALRTHLADPTLPERTRALLAISEVAAVALDGVKLVEKLILFQANLLLLARNMVWLPDLFDANSRSLTEYGMFVFDGREFDLGLPVTDQGRAERFATMSPLCVLFVLVGEKGGTLDQQFMVPVTAGELGHLVDGTWGVAIGVDGVERHAFIRKIARAPISIKEALVAPFRRLGEAVQSALDKQASSQSSAMDAQVSSAAESAATKASNVTTDTVAAGEAAKAATAAPPVAPAPAPAAPAGPGMAGQLPLILAGAGVALAALAGAATFIIKVFMDAAAALAAGILALPVLDELPAAAQSVVHLAALPFAISILLLGVILVPVLIYAIPIAIATWFRLRRRDLATLLEASGWAMNVRLYLDRPLAVRLTRRPGSVV
jgi:hypothetical protein